MKERLNPTYLFLLPMNMENKQQNKRRQLILFSVVSVGLLLLPLLNGRADDVFAASTLLTATRNSSIKSVTSNNSLVVAQGPFYEANIGKVIGQIVISSGGAPQIQVSVMENGTINGIGNVTNLETWLDTYRSPTIINAVGHGILTTKDRQMATWIAHDIGRINVNTGVTTFKGIMFFNTNSTGKLAFLNNLEGLYITDTNGNMRTTKIWEWK
jgi:hypothetical protein